MARKPQVTRTIKRQIVTALLVNPETTVSRKARFEISVRCKRNAQIVEAITQQLSKNEKVVCIYESKLIFRKYYMEEEEFIAKAKYEDIKEG